jgi:hypothetical protein
VNSVAEIFKRVRPPLHLRDEPGDFRCAQHTHACSVTARMDQEQPSSRIVYPKLPATLTEIDLPRLFSVTSEEWAWARTVARRGPSMVALLTHLKMFQCLTANSMCVILHFVIVHA